MSFSGGHLSHYIYFLKGSKKEVPVSPLIGSRCRVASVVVASVGLMGSQWRLAKVGVASVEGSSSLHATLGLEIMES